MRNRNWDPTALAAAVNILAISIAGQLDDSQLDMAAAVFNQLGDTLATIAVQREFNQLLNGQGNRPGSS